MTKEIEPRKSRASTHFKFFSEKYLWGSTRSELLPDERAVWVDFLCLASLNFGVIEAYSRDQLAQQLLISRELLDRSIEEFIKFGKITRKYHKKEKKEIFTIVKWSRFQADYLTKRSKKSTIYEKKERIEKMGKPDAENHPTLQERKGEKITLQQTTLKENTTSDNADLNKIDIKLTQLLIDLMIKNDPKSQIFQNLTEKKQEEWINQCRLLRENDGRSPEEIEMIIRWCQQDLFWKSNILSMFKLREKFSQLLLKAKKTSFYGIQAWIEARRSRRLPNIAEGVEKH